MKKFVCLIVMAFIGFVLGYQWNVRKCDAIIQDIQESAREYYEQQLGNPARCLSVCVEYFEKMGG